MPLGSGKTRVVCRWARHKPGLRWVLCPNAAVPVWIEEVRKWTRETISTLTGTRYNKITQMKHPKTQWLVIPYQTYRSLANYMLSTDHPSVAILDESHYIKNPKAQVTKAVHAWLKDSPSRAILTATPMGNTELDLWAQWYFLDRGESMGKSFYQFRAGYFVPDSMGWNWTMLPWAKRKVNRAILKTGVIMSEDEIDLPPKTYGIRYTPLSTLQKRFYNDMEEEFAIWASEKGVRTEVLIETQWILVRLMRLRQICSGFFKDDRGKLHTFHSNKYSMLMEMLEEMRGHQVVIWCTFRKEIARISEMLRKYAISHVIYKGGMKNAERTSVVDAFQARKARVFLGQVAAGGIAITLTASDRAIYFSNGYSLIHRSQSEGRTRRIGSERFNRIHYEDLITEGTIEDEIRDLLVAKHIRQRTVVLRHLIESRIGGG
jgi:SNF2 family DNA or RNA helicase